MHLGNFFHESASLSGVITQEYVALRVSPGVWRAGGGGGELKHGGPDESFYRERVNRAQAHILGSLALSPVRDPCPTADTNILAFKIGSRQVWVMVLVAGILSCSDIRTGRV